MQRWGLFYAIVQVNYSISKANKPHLHTAKCSRDVRGTSRHYLRSRSVGTAALCCSAAKARDLWPGRLDARPCVASASRVAAPTSTDGVPPRPKQSNTHASRLRILPPPLPCYPSSPSALSPCLRPSPPSPHQHPSAHPSSQQKSQS